MASPPPEPGLNGLVWNLHPFIQRTGLVHLPAHLRPPPGLQPREVDTARASGPSFLKSTSQQDSHKYGGGRRAAWKLESTASHQTFFWLWQGPFRYIHRPAKRLVLFLRPMRNIQKPQNLIWCCIAAMVEIVRVLYHFLRDPALAVQLLPSFAEIAIFSRNQTCTGKRSSNEKIIEICFKCISQQSKKLLEKGWADCFPTCSCLTFVQHCIPDSNS